MGFVSKLLENENVHWYYIVGILIFMSLFTVILIRTLRMKKSDIIAIKTSILDNNETEAESLKE